MMAATRMERRGKGKLRKLLGGEEGGRPFPAVIFLEIFKERKKKRKGGVLEGREREGK